MLTSLPMCSEVMSANARASAAMFDITLGEHRK